MYIKPLIRKTGSEGGWLVSKCAHKVFAKLTKRMNIHNENSC